MALLYEEREIILNFKEDKPTVYRIAPVKQQQITFEMLLDEVSNSCGVNRAQTKAAIEGLLDRTIHYMELGMSVKFGDFGSFKPTITVKSQKSVDDLGADNVKRKKILFTPGKRFKSMLEKLSVITLGNSKSVVSGGGPLDNGDDDGDDGGGNDDGGGFVDPAA